MSVFWRFRVSSSVKIFCLLPWQTMPSTVRGRNSPFSCKNCTIFLRPCGKIFHWGIEKLENWQAAFQRLGRPQGKPHSSGWAARKDCHIPATGPPARDFIGWRADRDLRDLRDHREVARARLRAMPFASAKQMLPRHAIRQQAFFWREAPPRRAPGGLGGPGGPGPGARHAPAASRLPSHSHAPSCPPRQRARHRCRALRACHGLY